MKTQDDRATDFIRSFYRKLDEGINSSALNSYSPEASAVVGGVRYSGKEEVKDLFQEFFRRMANPKHELKGIKVETSGNEVIVTLDWRLNVYIKRAAKNVTIVGSDKLWLFYEGNKLRIVEHDIFPNFTKTFLRHGPKNFLNIIKSKEHFKF